jgi:hypothetical protein
MAIIWADFPSAQTGLYGTDRNLMLNGIWAGFEGAAPEYVTIQNDPDPAIGAAGRVLRTRNANFTVSGARFALPAGPTETVGVGARLWLSELPSGNWSSSGGPLIEFRTSGNITIAALTVLANGAIALATNATGGTTLGSTAGPVVVANAYNHVEVKFKRSATVGECEVRVNGSAVLTLTGLALGSLNPAILSLGSNSRPGVTTDCIASWKDIVFWDTTTSFGNDFQGSVSVRDLIPDGDAALNWTPSTGSTGFPILDNSPPNDAEYISAGDPPPDPARFTLTNLPDDVTTVRALLPILRARKTDGGDCNIQMGLSPDNVDWTVGADRPMTTAFTYWWDVSPTSPDTLVAWTPSEVNGAQVRVDRTL